jgi:heme-degrading monooxygenase HmoA
VILRVLTARVPNRNIGEFNELLRAQLSELREQPGLVYAKLARRLDEDQTEEVVLVEEWRTTADLFAWTGGRLNRPRLLRGTEELVDRLVITHYEALDLSPEDLQQRILESQAKAPLISEAALDRDDGADGTPDEADGVRAAEGVTGTDRTGSADRSAATADILPPSGVLRS